MPRGEKDKYTEQQKRKAEHIEQSYESRGVPKGEAEARAWATVNKQSGGGEKKGGSGQRKSPTAKSADRKGVSPSSSARSSGVRGGSLESLNKDELMKRAASNGITGRSRMRKAELVDALRAA